MSSKPRSPTFGTRTSRSSACRRSTGTSTRGTRLQHQPFGSDSSLPGLTAGDVKDFYETYYRPANVIVGISTSDPDVKKKVLASVKSLPAGAGAMPKVVVGTAAAISGRKAVVVVEPNAPAAGVHLGFPLSVNRTHPDFWPLYVAHVWLGVHRDSFGRLFQQIRQVRGYNYGDYAYVEHWRGKPSNLFQTYNQPRRQQYFSIWIRPVGHDHAYHLAKAATWELERLIRDGLTDEQVVEAKKKAKILYLNMGETVNQLLAARVDDQFYGMKEGFLDAYIDRLEAVTAAQVNQAIQRHLSVDNVKYVFVTDAAHADGLVAALEGNQPAYGKSLKDYEIKKVAAKGAPAVWQVPEDKLEMLRLDAQWANYRLDVDSVQKVPVGAVFKTGDFVAK